MATHSLVRYDKVPPIFEDLGYDRTCVFVIEPEPGEDPWSVEHFARHYLHTADDDVVVVIVRIPPDWEEEARIALPEWRDDVVFIVAPDLLATGETQRWYFVEPIPLERDEFADEYVPLEIGIGY